MATTESTHSLSAKPPLPGKILVQEPLPLQHLLPPPSVPRPDLTQIMEKGGSLNKLQARTAFAFYLQRVQQRLMQESSKPEERSDSSSKNDEQMELVLRFLKRAAGNLQQPFKVIVPSRKLPLHDRRRILAKQLGDFVHIYGKETDILHQRRKIDKKLGQTKQEDDGIEEEKFVIFLGNATESELEEVLTAYTKANKSASIFLGTNSKTTQELKSVSSTASQGPNASLLQRRNSATDLQKTVIEDKGGERPHTSYVGYMGQHSSESSASSGVSGGYGSGAAAPMTPASSSYHAAASIYSAKMPRSRPTSASRPNSASTRPSSAKSTASAKISSYLDRVRKMYKITFFDELELRDGASYRSSSRPNSAYTVYRDNDGGEIAARHFSDQSEQAIQDALHRLAKRQAARQYSAANQQNANLITNQFLPKQEGGQPPVAPPAPAAKPGGGGGGQMSSVIQSHTTTSITANYPTGHYPSQRLQDSATTLHEQGQGQARAGGKHLSVYDPSKKANSTDRGIVYANSYTTDSSTQTISANDSAAAYNTVTGVVPVTPYQPTSGSYQLQYALQQQRHGDQPGGQGGDSTATLRQDLIQQQKVKHQAKIAQAHSNISQQLAARMGTPPGSGGVGASSQQGFIPKPPTKLPLGRKPVSMQRLARTSHLDDSYNKDVYSSLKYSNYTGVTKPVTSSNYNTGAHLSQLASQWKGGVYSAERH